MFQEESCNIEIELLRKQTLSWKIKTYFYNVTNIAQIFWFNVRQETVSNVLRGGNSGPVADALTPLCQPEDMGSDLD